jgi:hypothetical protein
MKQCAVCKKTITDTMLDVEHAAHIGDKFLHMWCINKLPEAEKLKNETQQRSKLFD